MLGVLAVGLAHRPAAASGWTVKDLGGAATEQDCADRAWEVFARYRRDAELDDLTRRGWVVYAYGLGSAAYDGLITCSYGPAGGARATLVVHSSGAADPGQRGKIAEAVARHWREAN